MNALQGNHARSQGFLDGRRTTMENLSKVVVASGLVFYFSGIVLAADTDGIQPAPPSIGGDVPVTYFGPQPSAVKRELIGEYQNLKSGTVDKDKGTITLPLYEGAMKSGEVVWYIVTDSDDAGNASALGLNYSAKLTFSDIGRSVRKERTSHAPAIAPAVQPCAL